MRYDWSMTMDGSIWWRCFGVDQTVRLLLAFVYLHGDKTTSKKYLIQRIFSLAMRREWKRQKKKNKQKNTNVKNPNIPVNYRGTYITINFIFNMHDDTWIYLVWLMISWCMCWNDRPYWPCAVFIQEEQFFFLFLFAQIVVVSFVGRTIERARGRFAHTENEIVGNRRLCKRCQQSCK